MKVSIIILNYNGNQDTDAAIASLQEQTYRNFEIIVIDNGSSSPYSRPGIILIRSEKNLGFAQGNNIGIQRAMQMGTDAIWMLNNDTEVEPDTLANLVAFSKKNPDAIIGARLTQFDTRTKLDHVGGIWNHKKANFDLIGSNEPSDQFNKTLECDFVCGASLFAPVDIFKKVGLLEAKFFLIWEESDFCMRAKRLDFKVLYCPTAIVYHKVSASFTGGKPHTHYFWWRNRLLWIKRNLSQKEKKQAYKIIRKELVKLVRHFILRSILKGRKDQKLRAYRAAIQGTFDYLRGRFGAAPNWLLRK